MVIGIFRLPIFNLSFTIYNNFIVVLLLFFIYFSNKPRGEKYLFSHTFTQKSHLNFTKMTLIQSKMFVDHCEVNGNMIK
jgi:hypothetical protein